MDWSKKSFRAQIADYKSGLVTNLDVLSAITIFQDSQRLLDREHIQARLDEVRLELATADRSELRDLDE